MTTHWMPLYVGDYLADTMHLTQAQHGAYLLLMMHYWKRGSLPAMHEQCMCIASAKNEQDRQNVEAVLAEFFTIEDGTYRHSRIDAELAKASESYERRASAAKKRWEGKKKGDAMHMQSMSIDDAKPDAMHEQPQPQPYCLPIGKQNKGSAARFDPLAVELPPSIPASSWSDWIAYRRSRKLTNNEATVKAQVSKLNEWAEAGYDPGQIINESITNGWSGLFEPKAPANTNQPRGNGNGQLNGQHGERMRVAGGIFPASSEWDAIDATARRLDG